MDFRKYTEIENSYQENFILKMIEKYPEIKNEKYLITEKIDGANIALYFTPNKPTKVASRNHILEENESFNDIWNTLKKYETELFKFQKYADVSVTEFILIGELFGKGIQGRIKYGNEKFIKFFDAIIDDNYLSGREFLKLFNMFFDSCKEMIVPVIAIVNDLDKALNFDASFNSRILDIENNIAEGIVIKGYDKVIYDWNNSPFYLKKKTEEFQEKSKVSPKELKPVATEVEEFHNNFIQYITENRLLSVFSKEGQIKENKEIGKYLALLIEDAKKDFLKDFNTEKLGKDQLKYIFNIGKLGFDLLKKYL